jgi:hypothetical protein
LFSNTLSLYSSLNVREQVFTHAEPQAKLSIYLSSYGFRALVDCTQSVVRTSSKVDQPCRKATTCTEQQKHRINAQRHPCLKWDSNPRCPVSEWAKSVHTLDRTATVMG